MKKTDRRPLLDRLLGRYGSVVVFVLLTTASALASIKSYRTTEARIAQDMDRALALTMAETSTRLITPDTLQTYRSHLTIDDMREKTFLSYDNIAGEDRIRYFSTASFATIFRLSDQRLSLAFSLAAMLWAMFALQRLRSRRQSLADMLWVGSLGYNSADGRFYDHACEPIRLTPMQHQLMTLFFHSEGHRLTKTEICKSLWPGKEDASETLYTLVRRLKQVLEANSNLAIEADRGRGYVLESR